MKKLCSLLAAFMALVMLAAPALAEPTAAQVIRLSNPTITVDGVTVSGLEDLALQLALCESGDRSVMQLIFDLFIGGENASSAMLQLDDTAAVALLGGMSSAYRVYFEDVAALMESGSADMLALAENWTLPADIAAVMEAHSGDFLVDEPEVITNSDGVVMQYYYFTGDMTGCIVDIMRLIENDELIGAVLSALDPEASLEGLADELAESGLAFGLSGTYGHDNFGYVTEMDLTITIYENDEFMGLVEGVYAVSIDENDVSNINYDCRIVQKDAADRVMMDATVDMAATANSFTASYTELTPSLEITSDLVWNSSNGLDSFSCTAEITDDYGYDSAFSIVGTLMDTADGWTLNANVSSEEDGETSRISLRADYSASVEAESLDASMKVADAYSAASIELNLSRNPYEGVYYGTLSVNDGYDDVSIGLLIEPTETAAGADYSGVISLLLNDGVSDIRLNVDVTLLTATVDTDKFYVDPSSAVDVLTISPAQADAASAELETIVNSILSRLEEAYPSIFGGITGEY